MLSGKTCPTCGAPTDLVGPKCKEVCIKCRKVVEWTVQRVKDELPSVEIQTEYGLLKARVTGRLCQFATVSIYDKPWYTSFAWETIADCLNRGVPLRA